MRKTVSKKPSGAALPLGERIKRELGKNYELYIMFIPVLAFYLIFCYKPMYGLLMAFQDYKPSLGI